MSLDQQTSNCSSSIDLVFEVPINTPPNESPASSRKMYGSDAMSGEWPDIITEEEEEATDEITPLHPPTSPSLYHPYVERAMSLELLDPVHASPLWKSSILVATFNLVATIVGGGVLSLPLTFAKAGMVPASLMMVLAAVITDFALYILCSCSRRTGARSYAEVARMAFGPKLEVFTTILLFIFLLFVIIAFMVLNRDIWTPILNTLVIAPLLRFLHLDAATDSGIKDGNFVLLLVVFLVSPFLLKEDLHALRNNCYIGFFSVTILCVALVIRAWQKCSTDSGQTSDVNDDLLWFTSSFADALYAFPIITLSFLSSFNIISVHAALIDPTRKRVRMVIDGAIWSCFALTYVFGLAGYLFARSDTKGNILLNFPFEDWLVLAGRAGCGITLSLALPIVTLPCREACLELVTLQYNKMRSRGSNSSTPVISLHDHDFGHNAKEDTPLLSKNYSSGMSNGACNNHKPTPSSITQSKFVHVGTTFLIIASCYIGAVAAPGVAIVWSICGSSMAFLIAFILPSACYIKIRSGRKGHGNQRVMQAWVLLIFSCVGAIVCTIQVVWRMMFVGGLE